MNLLKKARIVLIAFFALLFSLTIASCDKSSDEPVNPGQGITDNDESFTKANANVSEDGYDFDNANLSSIDINVSNAKTTFFLGDTFSSEGVTVTANFLTSVDGKNKLGSFTTTDFTVDSSEVDMYNIGTYPVEVTYRYKATVNKKSYNINVISSELANSGLEYVGGIEAKYYSSADNKYVNSVSLELGTSFESALSKFQIKEHIFTGLTETKSKTIASTNYSTDGSTSVKIDTSKVDNTKRGDYIINIEYTPESVVVNSKTISYKVKAFIFVHVIDPITDVKFTDGTTSFAASAEDFDYSDWTFKITRKISGETIVKYNTTDFTVSGIVPFITGTQTAVINCADYLYTIYLDLTVTESTTYNITTSNIYEVTTDEEGTKTCTGTVWSDSITTSSVDVALDDTGLFKITKPSAFVAASSRLNKGMSRDFYGSLYFGARATVKGNGSYISVQMDNPGTLVIYVAAPNDGKRDISVNSTLDVADDDVTQYTSESKQTITQLVFKVETAGTYYIQSNASAYIHGIVVAVSK